MERNAKFPSSRQKANQLDVKIASERTDLSEVLAATIVDSTTDQGKCTKQLVQTVERNAKCHSNQAETSQYDVRNVFKRLETKVSN